MRVEEVLSCNLICVRLNFVNDSKERHNPESPSNALIKQGLGLWAILIPYVEGRVGTFVSNHK